MNIPQSQQNVRKTEPIVSVIVPCYNSERTIRLCLESIIGQKTSVDFEVVVVDSSTDQTASIVGREFPTVRLIRVERRTYAAAARNIGIRESRGAFCLMIDSDCIARPDLIENVIARHREDNYAAVGGALRNGTPRSLSGLIGYLIEFKEFMPTTPLRIEKSVPTANLAYRRDELNRLGLFDEQMRLGEDILLNWRITRAGGKILFDPAIEVTHLNRTGWKQVLSYQAELGMYSARARRIGNLPGEFLIRFPVLIALMPLVRTYRAAIWLARFDRRLFLLFLLIWPLYLLASTFWSYGFFFETSSEIENS